MNKSNIHNEADYLGIVRHFINSGHIHTFSTFEKIISNGSFDRLSHGEEEPKGGVLCTIAANGENSFTFIENKGSKKYITIKLIGLDLDKALEKIDKVVIKLPNNSHVRIKCDKLHPIFQAFDDFKIKYPFLNFTKDTSEKDDDSYLLVDDSIQLDSTYQQISITRDSIIPLLRHEIDSKYKLSDRQNTILNMILSETLGD